MKECLLAKCFAAGDGAEEICRLHCEVAGTFWRRLRGLLGRRGLAKGEAMLIRKCNAVHTVGMRFALDLLFLDGKGNVVRTVRDVAPGRFCVWGTLRAKEVIEIAAGGLPDEEIARIVFQRCE